jgi:archaellum biogenesis ATPase FlaH
MEEEPKNNLEPVVESAKIIAAREWLRDEMRKYPQHRYIDSRTYDEFYEWCANYSEPFYEHECEAIWDTEIVAELDRRKKDGRWYIEQEDLANSIHAYTWDEIDYLEFSANKWRIKNLLPLEGFVILAGVSGEGKSFVSMEMANALTTPRAFLNEQGFSVIGCSVLYIDAEMSKSELQRRGRQLGFSEKREYELLFVSRNELNLKDDTEGEIGGDDLGKVLSIIEKHKVKVVFVDTLRAVAGGMEENKAEEVRKFFNRFKPLKDMGVCVVFLDHLRKGFGPKQNEPQKDSLLASQDKTASVEVLLMLQKKPSEPIITVHQRKNRLGPESASFDIRLYDTDMDPDKNRIILEFKGTHDSVESVIEKAKATALKALEGGDMTRQELLDHVKEETGIGVRSVHVALKALQESKLVGIEKVGRQHKYSTNTGDPGDVENKILSD